MESTSLKGKYHILVRGKNRCIVKDPLSPPPSPIQVLPECTAIYPAKRHIAFINSGKLSLYTTSNLQPVPNFPSLEVVSAVDFSPKEKYLCVIQKPSVKQNLNVFSLETYTVSFSFTSLTNPLTQWPQISYDPSETLVFRHIKTTIDMFKIDPETKQQVQLGTLEHVVGYIEAQYTAENGQIENALAIGKVIPGPGESKKCFFNLYNLKDLSKPIKETAMGLTDRIKFKISKDNKYLLINAINDSTSSKSYYGTSVLYFTDITKAKFTKFSLPDGPIHDFDWCPNGENFIVCAGYFPSRTNFYDKNGSFIKEIACGKFSNLYISPDNRIVALCGFGSLNGDIEFYDLSGGFKLIGKTNFFCCSNLYWSGDSKYLLGAVLWDKVKMDNEYRIMTYNGEEIVSVKDGSELHDCFWVYDEKLQYEEFEIKVNTKSLEKKEKKGVILTSTLGTINFSNKGDPKEENQGGIVGLGKKKKKKKK